MAIAMNWKSIVLVLWAFSAENVTRFARGLLRCAGPPPSKVPEGGLPGTSLSGHQSGVGNITPVWVAEGSASRYPRADG